jgi:pyruvate, water dikinase
VITFAEILKDKGYPGFDPVKHINAPWVSDQLSLFKPEDEARFWFKGFQWPRAYPLNFVWLEDGFAWGTQAAAHNMPLPPSDGLAPRVAGIFVYGSDIPVTPWIAGSRAERVGAVLPPFLQNFPAIWDERRAEIVKSLRYLETYDLAGKSPAEIWQFMVDARAFHVRAWEIHFDLMYPLTANYLGFYGLCKELGIAAADIPKFLQGYETQPMKSDRLMWQLANNARHRGPQAHCRRRPARRLSGAHERTGGGGMVEGLRRFSSGIRLAQRQRRRRQFAGLGRGSEPLPWHYQIAAAKQRSLRFRE